MTRQLLAILIVVAIIAIIVRVIMQSSGTVVDVGSFIAVPTPTTTPALMVVAPDGNPLPTALPQALTTAVVATIQAATPRPISNAGSSSRPVVLPNTGVLDQLGWSTQAPFIAFVSIMCTVTVVGYWLGRNR